MMIPVKLVNEVVDANVVEVTMLLLILDPLLLPVNVVLIKSLWFKKLSMMTLLLVNIATVKNVTQHIPQILSLNKRKTVKKIS